MNSEQAPLASAKKRKKAVKEKRFNRLPISFQGLLNYLSPSTFTILYILLILEQL